MKNGTKTSYESDFSQPSENKAFSSMMEHLAKGLGDENINILGPWPGNSPNPQLALDKQNPTNSDKLQTFIMQGWAAMLVIILQYTRLTCDKKYLKTLKQQTL